MGLARLFRVLQNLTLDFIHFIKILLRCSQKRPRPIIDTKKRLWHWPTQLFFHERCGVVCAVLIAPRIILLSSEVSICAAWEVLCSPERSGLNEIIHFYSFWGVGCSPERSGLSEIIHFLWVLGGSVQSWALWTDRTPIKIPLITEFLSGWI